jgi:Na+-transporting NADH:ubiquinone oxidoreductase subunit C
MGHAAGNGASHAARGCVAMSSESIGRTLLVAAGVALFCSVMVSAAVIYLRPMQLAWAEIGRNRVIVGLAGLLEEPQQASDREVAARFLELDVLLVDLASGRADRDRDALRYAPRETGTLARDGVDIPADLDRAQLGRRSRLAPAYLRIDEGVLRTVILPIHGQGMWAPIHGYLALEGDCSTVAGIAFDEHGETPGVGDRIEAPGWRATWTGLRAMGPAGEVLLAPRDGGRAGADPGPGSEFDAISGATVTVNAVTRIVQYWLGPHGFGPFLARCRAGEELLP